MTVREHLLRDIERFCRQTRTSEHAFGMAVAKDHKLVPQIRDGRAPTASTIDAINAFIRANGGKKKRRR